MNEARWVELEERRSDKADNVESREERCERRE